MFKIFSLEFKRIIKNPLFYIIGILVISFTITQFGGDIDPERVARPVIGQESYGTYESKDLNIIKPKALEHLVFEYINNRYTTYPYGFYKAIRLSEEKDQEIGKVLSAITGESLEVIKGLKNGDVQPIEVKADLTDESFTELMKVADGIIGKGSYYGENYLISMFGRAPKNYEKASEDYDLILEKDRISGAYARLFADYMGIILGIAPVFLAVGIWYLDKSSKSQDLLYIREVKSRNMVWGRYFAMAASLALVILAMATYYNLRVVHYFGMKNIDLFAFYKYSILWLMPTMMVSLGFGTLITVVTESPLGIVGQLAWWFLDISAKTGSITGGSYGWSMILRHNTVGNTLGYINSIERIFMNRIIYILFAFIMVIIAEIIFNEKRMGGINAF